MHVRVGDEAVRRHRAVGVLKPRRIPHTMWNAEPEAARIIEVYTPGGFELFFKDFGKRLRQGPIGLDELNRLGEPHGIRFFDDWIPELNLPGQRLGRPHRVTRAAVAPRTAWTRSWSLAARDKFDKDFGLGEWHGTNAFMSHGDRVFRTYFINNRGDEQMGSTWNYPRHHCARAPGGVGGLAEGLSPDRAVRVVDLARRIRRRPTAPILERSQRGRPRSRRPATAAQSFEGREGEVIDNVSRGDAIKLSAQLKSVSRTCFLLRRSIEERKRKLEHTNNDIKKNRLAFAA
jgi:Bacterial protein of unknown function (DUF899)